MQIPEAIEIAHQLYRELNYDGNPVLDDDQKMALGVLIEAARRAHTVDRVTLLTRPTHTSYHQA